MSNIIYLPNGMEAIEAQYSNFPLAEFNENPFIQALPPLADKSTMIKKMTVNPLFDEQEREADAVYRLHMINRLYQFYQPLPIHLRIWEMIHSLIMQGYLARNPFDSNYVRYINETGKSIINRTYDINSRKNFRTTASAGTLIGFSGMGKTTSFNRVLSNIPQIIVHNEYRGQHFSQIQLVYLKLDAPPTSSLKALCLQFFMKVDELLGSNNYKKYVSRNMSVDSMLPLIGQLAHNIGLGLLVIDEIQNIRNKSGNQIMNFFVNLINSGVNLALIGTPSSYELFSKELRLARRLTGNSEIIYNNMDYNEEFKFLLESMWKYQWTRKYTPITEELAKVFYEETQGISSLIVSLFVYSQQTAIQTGKEELTVELVRKVAKEKFKLMREMLDAIRSGNPYKIMKYEDIRRLEENSTIQKTAYLNKKKERARDFEIKDEPKEEPKKVKENKMANSTVKQGNLEDDLRKLFNERKSVNKTPYELLLESGNIDDMKLWIEGSQHA